MKLKNLFLILAILLLFASVGVTSKLVGTSPQQQIYHPTQNVSVSIEIISHEIKDSYVVGDFFWYKINFTNMGVGTVNDTFNVSIFNPSGNLIDSRNYEILLKSNEGKIINSSGGKENEVAAIPFDTNGDYKMEIKSTKLIDFYRYFDVKGRDLKYKSYTRQPMTFKYFFDVMPIWQYNLWNNTEAINKEMLNVTKEVNDATKKSLELTGELNKATKEMKDATNGIRLATYAMLVVAAITLFVALKKG